jgi:hypothetical protein
VLGFLVCGFDEGEISRWPWRIVFLSNLLGSLVSVHVAMQEAMADLYLLHLLNTMLQVLWWIMFCMCLWKSPALVRDATKPPASASASDGRPSAEPDYSYEAALDAIGRSSGEVALPIVCHSCRVRRPLRSKHCKVLKSCVHKVNIIVLFSYFPIFNLTNRYCPKYYFSFFPCHFFISGWSLGMLPCCSSITSGKFR